MRENKLAIHSENILPIIKKWLYSDKEIFLRELISNATDAINKTKVLRDQGQLDAPDSEFSISVHLDKAQKTLTISDTGIGMTEDEVEKYIAQIAFSGAEEFVKKYQKEHEKDPIIGHFGLGFYSAYMVASKVEIQTLSYASGAKPVFWSSDGSSSYQIGEGSRKMRGTDITLFLKSEELEFLEEGKIFELLRKYCLFLPYPILCNKKALENASPLWLKAPSECTEKEYLALYRKLYPMQRDPLFWIHLNVDYPFRLQGILYFPKIQSKTTLKDSHVQLFSNRVFVSDSCKDILPDYLMMLEGAIDSPDIPLNVSRSYLQVDQNVKQLSSHISKKVADKLSEIYKKDPKSYQDAWEHLEVILKLGILQDDKFYERAKDLLIWKSSEKEWTQIQEYLERAKEKKVFYQMGEDVTPILKLYKEKGIEVLFANSPIDTAVIQKLEEKLSLSFQRVDGAIDPALLDPSKEKSLLDSNGKSEAVKMADCIRHCLDIKGVEVEAKSFSSDHLFGLVVFDEKERRFRDYMALSTGKAFDEAVGKRTFVVNTNNKLIQAIEKLSHNQPALSQELAKGIYDLSLLSQKEMGAKDWEQAIQRQGELLERLAGLIS